MIPAGTRDIRPSAFELKFVVDCDLGARIREAARALLSPDPHASGPAADEYLTNTIYLDTEEFAVYRRRGSFRRAKYRIRRYGQGNAVFLERKLRTADVLSKRRSVVLADDLHRLSGDLNGEAWAGKWFHERMLMRRLMPVCQVSYARTARVGVTDYGPVRLTLDEALAGAPVNEPVFQDATPLKLFPGKTIVEMKFTAVMPAPFKKIVEDFAIAPQRVSKYRLGVEGARSLSPLTHPPSEDASAYA